MPTHYPVPTHNAIQTVLAGIVGDRPVTVEARTGALDPAAPGVLADYGADEGPVGALCMVDLPLTNAVGGALASETAEQIEAACAEGRIADATVENWNEVVQQIARLLNSPDTPPLRVRGVHRLPSDLSAETSSLLADPRARRTFEVTIGDLGRGTLSLAVG
ncbi:MAG: hypothetical protein ACT4OX_08645 [Actinomycetota bacterium]